MPTTAPIIPNGVFIVSKVEQREASRLIASLAIPR
jgi:hypothetical protein